MIRTILVFSVCLVSAVCNRQLSAEEQDFIAVSANQKSFEWSKSKKPFSPWGFNYDHDEQGRLLEDYWDAEWPKVAEYFREMRQLGANVVRIHLQFARFMTDRETPNPKALEQLTRLLTLAQKTELALDLTGLGCYHKQDVPAWYDELTEQERWAAQARFWEAVAERCANSPAVFCYDLMNEPISPAGRSKPSDWLGPAFAGKHFVQRISLDQQDRPRPEIARQWIKLLVKSIRKHDRRHLVTVGLVDWSLDRPGLTSGFVPEKIVEDLDFLCVHLYPEKDAVPAALKTLSDFSVGKPVVIEETFPLKCGIPDFTQFVEGSKPMAAGVIGFYWGKTIDEYKQSNTITDALMQAWLEYFQKHSPRDGR